MFNQAGPLSAGSCSTRGLSPACHEAAISGARAVLDQGLLTEEDVPLWKCLAQNRRLPEGTNTERLLRIKRATTRPIVSLAQFARVLVAECDLRRCRETQEIPVVLEGTHSEVRRGLETLLPQLRSMGLGKQADLAEAILLAHSDACQADILAEVAE